MSCFWSCPDLCATVVKRARRSVAGVTSFHIYSSCLHDRLSSTPHPPASDSLEILPICHFAPSAPDLSIMSVEELGSELTPFVVPIAATTLQLGVCVFSLRELDRRRWFLLRLSVTLTAITAMRLVTLTLCEPTKAARLVFLSP